MEGKQETSHRQDIQAAHDKIMAEGNKIAAAHNSNPDAIGVMTFSKMWKGYGFVLDLSSVRNGKLRERDTNS